MEQQQQRVQETNGAPTIANEQGAKKVKIYKNETGTNLITHYSISACN